MPVASFIALAAAVRPSGLLGSLQIMSVTYDAMIVTCRQDTYALGLFLGFVFVVSLSSSSTPAPSSRFRPVFEVVGFSGLVSLVGDEEPLLLLEADVVSGSALTAAIVAGSSGVITFAVDRGDAFA